MKNSFGLILIGLLIRNGLADVSHLSKHGRNRFLPSQSAQNLFIEQDYNGINSPKSDNEAGQSQQQSGLDNGDSRGYLPPYQEQSQNHHHHNHVHQHSQQQERGFLPQLFKNHQEQAYNNIINQQVNGNQAYVAPGGGQSNGQQKQNNYNQQEDDRGYLPPYQGQFEGHQHQHRNTQQQKQSSFDPNVQVSYFNNDALSLQQRDDGKNCNPEEEIEDNSQGYNYTPPKNAFEESNHNHHHHHHQAQQKNNLIGGPQSAINVVKSGQNGLQNLGQPLSESHHHHHQSNKESLRQSNSNQNLDVNLEYQNEEQSDRGYLPPLGLEQTNTLLKQAEQAGKLPTLNYQIQNDVGSNEEEDEQNYFPPISALELPQSTDTLHIVPPLNLGLNIQKSNKLSETGHVNVPLPIPRTGYYFVPGITTTLPSLAETKTKNLNSARIIPVIEGRQQNQQNQYQQQQQIQQQQQLQQQQILQQQNEQQQLSTNDISPAEYSRQSKSVISIIPSLQTSQERSSQGSLSLSQVVGQHFADIDFSSPDSNHLEGGQQNFPPLIQTQQQDQFVNQQLEQNQNAGQHTHSHHHHQHQEDESQSSFENFANAAVHGVRNQQNQVNRPFESINKNQENNGYLPPIEENQNQEDYSNQRLEAEISNQVTNSGSFVDNVNPNNSKPTPIEAYKAPAVGPYKAAGYLPPGGILNSAESQQQEYSSSIGSKLNEGVKKSLGHHTGRDNTIFPIVDILAQDDGMSQILQQVQGHIRTIQITNHYDNSVKNIRVHDSSNDEGVRTLEYLGQTNESPMGDHKVLHVISKEPNPQIIRQTIKVFHDKKEVPAPLPTPTTTNNQQPSSKINTNRYKLHRSY